MIEKNNDLIEIVKLRDQNKLLSELKTFFDTNEVSLTYNQFKTLLNSHRLYNKLKIAQIQEIWNNIKDYKQNRYNLSMTNEQLTTLRQKTFHNKTIREYQKRILDLDKKGKIKTFHRDFTLDLDFLDDYDKTINSNSNFVNPFKTNSVKYEENTNSKNAFYFLEQNQDFDAYKPNTILLSQKNIYKLVKKQKTNYLGDLYNDYYLNYLYWINDQLKRFNSFQNWREIIKNKNDVSKVISHSYDFSHLVDLKERINYEIVSYSHIKDKNRIIDRGFYPTNTTKLLSDKYPFVNLGETNYDLSCKYYQICSNDKISQNCQYCNTMLKLKKRYVKKQRRSYLLSFDYLNNNNIGIMEYINDLEDKYPKSIEITRDKQMIYLKNVKLLDLRTFKPIKAIKPKIRQSYKRTKHYEHLLRTCNEENLNAITLLKLALKKEKKYRKKLKANKSKKVNLLSEFVKNIGKKEVFDLEDGSTLYLKDNLQDRRIRNKTQNIRLDKKFNNQLRYLSDNIIYLKRLRDFNKHRKDIKKLKKKSKHYEDRIKVLKSDRAKIRNKKLANYYKRKAEELKSIDFNRIIILQEYFFEHRELNYRRFVQFFFDYLIKSDLSNLDKSMKDKIINLYRDHRNLGYNYIREDQELNSYFTKIFDNCIMNVSKIIDL